LANQGKFGVTGATSNDLELAARAEAAKHKKSNFALTYAIEDTDWVVPKYLLDGVRWLATDEVPVGDPVLAVAMEVAAEAAADARGGQ
jgi:putative ATP-dependent endonuclease of the OLD family